MGRQQQPLVGEGEIKFFMDGDQEFPTICEPEQKTTSAARGILNIRRENIVGFRRRIPDCIRF